jgi:hypothetical protein
MDAPMIALGLGVAMAVVGAIIWERAQKRRFDPQREELDFSTIMQRFYTGSDLTRADVERAYTRISEATGVAAGTLRPGDRFDGELKPRAGWELDDPIFIFSDRLARDAASAGVAVKLEDVATVDDAVHLMKRIHDARPRENDARSH